jgi:hypothetical protein
MRQRNRAKALNIWWQTGSYGFHCIALHFKNILIVPEFFWNLDKLVTQPGARKRVNASLLETKIARDEFGKK